MYPSELSSAIYIRRRLVPTSLQVGAQEHRLLTMSWLPYIPSDGEYRIKVYNSKQFVEYDPSSGTWLKLVDEFKQHSDKQQVCVGSNISRLILIRFQFRFTYQGRGSCYKINTCFDDSGLCKFQNKDTYWGYGYTRGGNSDSDVWVIESKQSEYAK